MHISFVKITNYRGIRGDQFEASPFTCAIGENNAGKSSILLATSLFFSGTALSKSDFFDIEQPIEIELTFSNIEAGDINRLNVEHRKRIEELIIESTLTLTRSYPVDGRTSLLCKRLVPKDKRFEKDVVDALLKGKKGKEIIEILSSTFSEFSDQFDKVKNQGEAKAKIEEIISSLLPEEKEMRLADLPTGIDNSIKTFLPEPIYIAAVKDLKDDVKSKESTTFGKLLGILLKFLETSHHFEEISESFNQLHALLNVIKEEENILDKRIEKLQVIEKQIELFLSENFPKSKVEIDIPKPELKQVLSNARILVDDGVRDIIDTKGDGLKRALTFALLRTYVEQLKQQKKEAVERPKEEKASAEESNEKASQQPYLFLFEEPELYLHPAAQKILFEALENLTIENNQVFVTTHSPLFFSPRVTGTFIKVTKEYPTNGKPFGKFIAINLLKHIKSKDAFQIICYENNTAAFFSKKVLLVEGDSDLIYIKEIARLLNNDWNFDNKNIPIISINGKSNIKRFVDFYSFFQIKTFCLVDSDALIDGFEKFCPSEQIKEQRSNLLAVLDKLADEHGIKADLSNDKIRDLSRKYTWKARYDRLKTIGQEIINGVSVSKEEMIELNYLFNEETNNKRRQIFVDKNIDIEGKDELLKALRVQNIFILSHGSIECYYPEKITGDDKPTKALNAIKYLQGVENCRIHLPTIKVEDNHKCELEIFFQQIFELD